MLNLETKKADFNCYEQILWSIMSFFNAPDCVSMIFADSWGFDFEFENTESLIGNRIYIHKIRELLIDVIGLKRKYCNFQNTEEFLEVLEQEMIKERPVIGWVDSYYSPWDINYKKFYGPHALIFLGVNREENIIYCSDRYYSPRIENLPIQNLSEMCSGYTTFEQVTLRYGMSKEQCFNLLKECVTKLITDDMFGKINHFGSYLEENFDISKEIDEFGNPERAPIITALNSIAHGRKAFNRSLEYVKLKFRQYELDYFIDKVKTAHDKWANIAMILRKYSMSPNKNFEIEKIVKILNNISEYEKSLVNELIEYLNGTLNKKIIAAKDEYEWDKSFKADNFVQVDLSKVFNNRAYAKNIENSLKANYNNNNEYCVVKKKLDNNRLIYESAKFKVNIADETEKYDNFGCNEQIIEVTEGKYSDLLVIASAQFGAQKTEVKLEYSDGTSEFVPLMISDWRSGCAFGEYDIYEGFCYKIMNELKSMPQGNSHLYLQRMSVDYNKQLKYIFLPFYPNMHIFAMGLCRDG